MNESINVRVNVSDKIDKKMFLLTLGLKQKALNIVVDFVHVAF